MTVRELFESAQAEGLANMDIRISVDLFKDFPGQPPLATIFVRDDDDEALELATLPAEIVK
jgi:hypothetical protein